MPFQVNISVTYSSESAFEWTGFIKFDCPILTDDGLAIQCVLTEAPTFEEVLDTLKNHASVKRYFKLVQDTEEGASQNAEGLVN